MVVLPRPRIVLAIVAVLILLGGVGGLVALSWLDREATLAEANDRLRLLSRLGESHVEALRRSGQELAGRIGEHYLAHPGAGEFRPWLEEQLDNIPHVEAVEILATDGTVLFATDHPVPLSPEESADLRAALARPGQPVIGLISPESRPGEHCAVLTVAFAEARGGRRGVVRLLIAPAYFSELYHGLNLPSGAVFTVLRRDGILVSRNPPLPNRIRLSPATPPFQRYAEAPTGLYRAPSLVDGLERLFSYRTLPELNLVVSVGLPVDRVFQGWRTRTQNSTALGAVALLFLLGLTAVADESMRHESRLLRSIKQKADELAAALADKDVLFQEVHHRVKNNLQVISSLLTMQSLHVRDEVARNTLKDALDRIHSMGLVHQTLYERNLAANVDLASYFGRLAEALAGSYGGGKGGAGVTVEVEVSGSLELERAVPLGMLTNEALSNALKHAFTEGRHGMVRVALHCRGGTWRLTIEDDGCGIASEPGRGIGLGLIRALARQLGGTVTITPGEGGGTRVAVEFPA